MIYSLVVGICVSSGNELIFHVEKMEKFGFFLSVTKTSYCVKF